MSMDTPDTIWADEAHARLTSASALCRDLNELAGWPPHSHVDRWARASQEELLQERHGGESARAFCARVLGTGRLVDVTPGETRAETNTTEALFGTMSEAELRTGLPEEMLRASFRELLLDATCGRPMSIIAGQAIKLLERNGPYWDGVCLVRRGERLMDCAYRVAMRLTSTGNRAPVDVPAALRRLVAEAAEPADRP